MPLDFLQVGAEPVSGYQCLEDLGGSVFQRLWRVRAPNGAVRNWKVLDLAAGNAAVETRTLEMLVRVRHPRLNTLVQYHTLPDLKALIIETETPLKSLRDCLAERRAQGHAGLSAEETVQWLSQAAEGIDYLNAPRHQFQGQQVAIYHRDLRPDVMLLFEQSGATACRVSDFGLAKPVTDQNAQHSQGLVHFDYDPPEYYEGVTAPTSDQYSLAIVHYELRTGKLPFHGTMLEQLQARLEDRPDLAGLPSEREKAALRRALLKDPKKRYGNCREFVAALAEALSQADEPAAAVEPPAVQHFGLPRAQPAAAYNYSGAAAAGAAVVAEARSASPLPGVVIRRAPPSRMPTITEIALESGETDLSGILLGAKPPAHRPAPAPARAPSPSPRLQAANQSAHDGKIPMGWVFAIAGLVFVAVAVLVKEFVLQR